MNGQSVGAAVTGTVAGTMSANALAQIIMWMANGMPLPMPESVAMSISAGALPILHLAYLGIMKAFGTGDRNMDLIPDALQNGGTKP